jgi:hypothetical protein
VWRRSLIDNGIDCRLSSSVSGNITDCDVLLVDSKYHRDRWRENADAILDEFWLWRKRCRIIYCDTTDSSGWLQTALLPVIDVYAKSQLLKDRSGYLKPMYGLRPYTNYYYNKFGIKDAQPEISRPVTDAALLAKLRVSWNSGLADYSEWGGRCNAFYRLLPITLLLHFPRGFTSPSAPRPGSVSCRFGTAYPRETVAYQRKQIAERLGSMIDTRKLKRHAYFRELKTSKIVVSPFGYGEITLKDFEVFYTGGLLLKPDMSHLETWPDFFRAGETMLTHAWDLSDFSAALSNAVENYERYQGLAGNGQYDYRLHTVDPGAGEKFAQHLHAVIS